MFCSLINYHFIDRIRKLILQSLDPILCSTSLDRCPKTIKRGFFQVLLPVSYCSVDIISIVATEAPGKILLFLSLSLLNFIYSLAKYLHPHNPPLPTCQKINDTAVFLRNVSTTQVNNLSFRTLKARQGQRWRERMACRAELAREQLSPHC